MKSTGIVRKLDDLGRIVLPIELRRTLNIDEHAPVEIFTEEDTIILRKYAPLPVCVFCGETKNLVTFYNRPICPKCADTIVEDFRRL